MKFIWLTQIFTTHVAFRWNRTYSYARKKVHHFQLKTKILPTMLFWLVTNRVWHKFQSVFWKLILKENTKNWLHNGIKWKEDNGYKHCIGTDNIDIVLNELDAAVNINPMTRL